MFNRFSRFNSAAALHSASSLNLEPQTRTAIALNPKPCALALKIHHRRAGRGWARMFSAWLGGAQRGDVLPLSAQGRVLAFSGRRPCALSIR